VTVLVLGVLAVVVLGMLLVVDTVFAAETDRDLDAVLAGHERIAVTLANQRADPLVLLRRVDSDSVRARLRLAGGQVFGDLPDSPATRQAAITLHTPGQLAGARLTLVTGTSAIDQAQAQLRRILVLVGLDVLVLAGLVVVVTVRVALSPLAALTGRARASEERTRRFVADAAHELRTPIAGVQAVAEAVLQQGQDLDPRERERLQLLLVRESRRAGQLVNDLLDLARIDAGVELHPGTVDLRALTDAQAERIRVQAPDLTVLVTGPPVTVWADEAKLTQIVANLLDNARHATEPGGHVDVGVREVDGSAELRVVDDGTGVPVQDRERIFDRLVRLDIGRDRRFGGAGLGLSIARGLARAHGGDLTCEQPADGRAGAVFRLRVPLRANGPAVQS
jgi:signal transduction histidine kinase